MIFRGSGSNWKCSGKVGKYKEKHNSSSYLTMLISMQYQTVQNLSSSSAQLTAFRLSFCDVCRRIRPHSTLPFTAVHETWVKLFKYTGTQKKTKYLSASLERTMPAVCLPSTLHNWRAPWKKRTSQYISFYRHHSMVFYFWCSVYWWKGSVRF